MRLFYLFPTTLWSKDDLKNQGHVWFGILWRKNIRIRLLGEKGALDGFERNKIQHPVLSIPEIAIFESEINWLLIHYCAQFIFYSIQFETLLYHKCRVNCMCMKTAYLPVLFWITSQHSTGNLISIVFDIYRTFNFTIKHSLLNIISVAMHLTFAISTVHTWKTNFCRMPLQYLFKQY